MLLKMFSNYRIILIIYGLLVSIVAYFQYSKIQKLETENQSLVLKYDFINQVLADEQNKFRVTIDNLNQEIKRYALDKEQYLKKIDSMTESINNETMEKESRIIHELQSDSSSNNQLKMTRDMLYDFANKNQ